MEKKNMLYLKRLLPCLVFFLFFSGFAVQNVEGQTIALHPIHSDDEEIAEISFDILAAELYRFPAGYLVYSIDLRDCPPDVPAGGFPANVCPSPSLTRGAPYAITGEVFNDPDFPGSFRLRLYLWEMGGNRLLVHDELTARDRESGEKQMRHLLAWLLSWIGSEEPLTIVEYMVIDRPVRAEEPVRTEVVAVPVEPIPILPSAPEWDPNLWYYKGPKRLRGQTTPFDDPAKWVYLGPEREKWLYMGLRVGGGSSQWYNDQNQAYGFSNQSVTNFWTANASMQMSLHLMRHLDIQTEANLCTDFGYLKDVTSGTVKDDKIYFNYYLTVPVLLKLTFRGSHLKTGIFAGAYWYLPLWEINNEKLGDYFKYEPDMPGLTAGMSLGWKTGPGFLFLDGRIDNDGRWFSGKRNVYYYRNIFKLNIGYEIGFFDKKVK